jgi:NAD(P)-dependent dehydrogenase (short-subunit alcohol dehydrogenase family)
VYHDDDRSARELQDICENAAVRLLIWKKDVANPTWINNFVSTIIEEFGGVDYLVNNVGINIFKRISETSFAEWKLAQDIILNAPFIMCKAVIPSMRIQKFGRIVNIGASAADYLKGAPGLAAFGVHKAALTVLTRTLAMEEIRHGITVNMIAPGPTENAGDIPDRDRISIDSLPLGRRTQISEIVDSVTYFLSDNACGITGQVLNINGGMST